MSINLLHIAKAWAKTHGLMDISQEEQELSNARLEICGVCDAAQESKALEVIKGSVEKMDIIYCTKCTCPCHEKSIIKEEKCPLNKW